LAAKKYVDHTPERKQSSQTPQHLDHHDQTTTPNMSAKRPRDEGAADTGASPVTDDARQAKKAKHGFRVGPENLPDGAWRRKGNHSCIRNPTRPRT
jgi:hypothetical protein